MALSADQIIDRRRLRRKLTFWRVATLVVLFGLIAALLSHFSTGNNDKTTDHIARLKISGVITEDERLLDVIEKVRKSEHVKGVILKINSPGGTVVGGEAIYEAVRKLAEEKPVVTSVGSLAASAGYMIASASDHIVARRSSMVGSIGVLFQYANVAELLNKVGVKYEEVKSSPLKAEPSPFHESTPEVKEVLKALIDDSYDWFRKLVKERRSMSESEIEIVADGRVFNGGQAVDLKLIDAVGGEDVARKWLIDEKGLSKDLKTIDWKKKTRSGSGLFSSSIIRVLAEAVGLSPKLDQSSIDAIVPPRLFLDGLISIWHGSSVKQDQ